LNQSLSICRPAILAGSILCITALGCAPLGPSSPAKKIRPPAAAAPDIHKHLVGVWWRAHGKRTQALRLEADGSLELTGVPPLRGIGWRVDGRKLIMRMRAVKSGDLYEDELYLRRLTDRTLHVEAGDSYFAGTYKRRRDAALTDEKPPVAAPLPPPVGRTLTSPIVLRRVAGEELAPRDTWLELVADLGTCDQQLNRNLCPRFYSDEQASLLIVEVCEKGRQLPEGVSIIDSLGSVASFPWFDRGFGRFACENDCSSTGSCRYEVVATSQRGMPTEMVYRFDIGPTWGWVRLQLGRAGAVKVIEHRIQQPE